MLKIHTEEFERELQVFENGLYVRFKKHFDLNASLYQKVSDVLGEKEKAIPLESDFQRAINFLFCRSYRLYWTIVILSQQGFGPEAGILLRSLMEQVVNMAWIGKENQDKRAKLFVDYSPVARKKLYDNYDKYGIFPNLTDAERELIESREEAERAYSEAKDNYSDERYWAPQHVSSRAKDVGLDYDWDFYYWFLSFIAHSNAASHFEFVRREETGDLFVVGPSDSMIQDVLHLSCKYLLLAFDMWNKAFVLGLDALVQEFSGKLTSISFIRQEQQSSFQK
jgi:hypothetical protein